MADNFQDTLVDALAPYPVDEIYGKMNEECIGGGRLSFLLPQVNRKAFERHVGSVQNSGISYNYLLNAACTDNQEITRAGQRKIRKILDRVQAMGIRRVTVANAFLLRIIRRCYPEIAVRVSVFAGVDSVPKAKMWEEMGAHCITLDSLGVNRELKILEALRQAVKIDLQLLVNNSCNLYCALSPSHMNFLAHGSQKNHPSSGFAPDYCFLYCTGMKMRKRVNYIRSDWIRPEDLEIYRDLGYDNFKITERGAPTSVLALRVKAYYEKSYRGNLLDLVQPFAYPAVKGKKSGSAISLLSLALRGFRPFTMNPFRLRHMGRIALYRDMIGPGKMPAPVYIDNELLNGFMDRFKSSGCRGEECEKCRHCHTWAERVVTVDREYRERCLKLYEKAEEVFETGSLWRYF